MKNVFGSRQYEIWNGRDPVLLYNISADPICFGRGTLLTWSPQRNAVDPRNCWNTFSVAFNDTEMKSSANCNASLNEGRNLSNLLSRYNRCFSSGLYDLDYGVVARMNIELNGSDRWYITLITCLI